MRIGRLDAQVRHREIEVVHRAARGQPVDVVGGAEVHHQRRVDTGRHGQLRLAEPVDAVDRHRIDHRVVGVLAQPDDLERGLAQLGEPDAQPQRHRRPGEPEFEPRAIAAPRIFTEWRGGV
jgi:hypothetical protein